MKSQEFIILVIMALGFILYSVALIKIAHSEKKKLKYKLMIELLRYENNRPIYSSIKVILDNADILEKHINK